MTHLHRAPGLLLVLAFVLAGCAAPGPAPPAAPSDAPATPDFDDLGLEATADLGIVRGVVVDASYRPLAGSQATLLPDNATVTTDDQGRFGFSGLVPGAYFVRADHSSYIPAQASVRVVAGDDDPPAVVLVLERLPETEPYVAGFVWDGFMECSLIAAGFFFTGCMVGDYTQDNSRKEDVVSRPPDFAQSELTWQSTQALGAYLCMKHYAREGSDFEPITDTQGRSSEACGQVPVVQSFNRTRLNETGVGVERGMERVVWVSYAVPGAVGVAFEQRFTVYTHLFYNFVANDGWTFIADGSHPLPP